MLATPQNTKEKKRKNERKPKKEFFIDFEGELPPESMFTLPINLHSISLPESAYSKYVSLLTTNKNRNNLLSLFRKARDLNTMRDDPPYNPDDLLKLFTKARFIESLSIVSQEDMV